MAVVIAIKSLANCVNVAKVSEAVLNYEVVKSGLVSLERFPTI